MDREVSQTIEDIKWFMFGSADDNENVKHNEMGFTHGLEFVAWCGDGCSFIVRDINDTEYRITATKEN